MSNRCRVDSDGLFRWDTYVLDGSIIKTTGGPSSAFQNAQYVAI